MIMFALVQRCVDVLINAMLGNGVKPTGIHIGRLMDSGLRRVLGLASPGPSQPDSQRGRDPMDHPPPDFSPVYHIWDGLPYDPDDPPEQPPTDCLDRMLWRVAYFLRLAHAPGPD